jgi:hypothetical protein
MRRTIERFMNFVPEARSDECWEWQSVRNRRGYGKFWLNGRTDLAHRVSYELHNGPIPAGDLVRHTCDNPPCVNPAHLLVGSRKDNARDAVERGQYLRGEDNPRAKLTAEQVCEIRTLWATRSETQVSMAQRLGVSRAAVQFALNGTSWTHLGDAS